MKKQRKLFLRELKRLSYTWTIFPVSAVIMVLLWSKGIVSKGSEVYPIFDWIFNGFLLNISKAGILVVIIPIIFFLIFLLCYNFNIPRKEKAILRIGFEFMMNQINNVFRILSGAIFGLWIIASYSDIVSSDEIHSLWFSVYSLLLSFVVTYISRDLYDGVIFKRT